MTSRARYIGFILLSLASVKGAHAAPPDAGVVSEARERFDRGLTLFNQGDNLGALAEFQRAYQLTGNATVLYNIARVQAAAGEPVAALETLDRLVTSSGELSTVRQAQVQALRREQRQRVGTVSIAAAAVASARLEVDGADSGPLANAPVRLAAGRHVIGVLAPGYHPLRKTVLIAGQEQKNLEFSLEPLAGALGRIRFQVEPIGVTVLLDGQELGKTPNLVEVAVSPGAHRLELERAGYARKSREISVPEAGLLDVSDTLRFDPASRAGHEGRLRVRSSEDESVVFVNGAAANEALGELRLPEGQHRLRVERAGFVASERLVDVPRGALLAIDVTLAPTAQYRADYASSVATRRGWALGLGVGGAVLASAATGYLIWNGAQVGDAEGAFDDAANAARAACQPATADCKELSAIAVIRKDDLGIKRDRQVLGWIGAGVGAAALTTGVVLWLTGKDPQRYEPKPESDVFGSLRISPWFGAKAAGLQLARAL